MGREDSIVEKLKSNFWFENISKVIALFTMAVTIISFIFRGLWYVYELGYYQAICVDRMYIDIQNISSLYYVLSYVGLALIFIFINYLVYLLLINEKSIWILGIVFFETILFFRIVFLLGNYSLQDVIVEIKQGKNGLEYLFLFIENYLILFTFNLYGVYFGIETNRKKKRKVENKKDNLKNKSSGTPMKTAIVFSVLTIVVEGLLIWGIGLKSGNDRKEYKVIMKEDKEVTDGRYTYNINGKALYIFPILYENDDIYIISQLYKDEKGNHIEFEYQRVISKFDIETVYYEDIFSIGTSEELALENEMKEENVEEDNGMGELVYILLGAIIGFIGSIIGVWGTYKVENSKKEVDIKKVETNAATMLLCDLRSVEKYISNEQNHVNIRYSNDWKNMIAKCLFINGENIEFIYQIYDEISNFNYAYEKKERKNKKISVKEIPQYKYISDMMYINSNWKYTEKYESLINELKAHTKG